MSRVLTIFGLLCLLPYAYMVYFWGFCDTCVPTADSWFYSIVLIIALPFLLAGIGIFSAIAAARSLRDNLVEKSPVRAVASSGFAWIAIIVAVPTLIASYKVYELLFPEVEEGRDRLGRICEKEGNVTHCRPDPDRQTDSLTMLNRQSR